MNIILRVVPQNLFAAVIISFFATHNFGGKLDPLALIMAPALWGTLIGLLIITVLPAQKLYLLFAVTIVWAAAVAFLIFGKPPQWVPQLLLENTKFLGTVAIGMAAAVSGHLH